MGTAKVLYTETQAVATERFEWQISDLVCKKCVRETLKDI
jgi:hypothetical protein